MLCFAVFDLFYLMPIVSVKLQLLKSGTTLRVYWMSLTEGTLVPNVIHGIHQQCVSPLES